MNLDMHIKAHGLPAPQKEYRFHPVRKWRLDYCWPEKGLAVEVHGSIHTQGRHTRGLGFERDREKMNEAMLAGIRVLEVTYDQIRSGQAIDWILRGFGEAEIAGNP